MYIILFLKRLFLIIIYLYLFILCITYLIEIYSLFIQIRDKEKKNRIRKL
jgi:predicted membrane protein